MYAVGQIISRSVYTFSAPFHPFGGAVDIVVVQQPDGSFKSSPWYVRFGKFQGVLKIREKVVNIAVNGVEAGFHMYLDSNGEAYFLRNMDPNADEGEFVVSPASSGDEREVLVQEAQLRKSKSTSSDSSTMEADVSDGKILARTSSRRTTILERMFGRKSVNNNAHVVDRVSSLERAEIAVELLDTKWSTNISRSSKLHGSNDKPSKSVVADVSNNDLVETSTAVLPENSFEHGKEMDSNCDSADCSFCSACGGRNSSADETDHCLQTTNVKEDVEIYAYESREFTEGITQSKHKLETDNGIHESDDIQSELLHSFEYVAGREMHTEEVRSNGIFEFHSVQTDITIGNDEVVSQFVTVDSGGAHQNLTNAALSTYTPTNVSTEKHEASLIPSAEDAVQEKVVVISSSMTVEDSHAVSSILDDKVHDASDIPLADIGQHDEEHSRVSNGRTEHLIFEERSLTCYSAPSEKENVINMVFQDQEAYILEDPTSQILQANCPDVDISVNTDVCNDSAHSLPFQHDLFHPDASSSSIETLGNETEYAKDVTNNSAVENKAYSRELDVSVIQSSPTRDEPEECAQPVNIPNKVDLESLATATGFSSLQNVEVQNTKIEDTDRFSSVSGDQVGLVPEATDEPREEAEAVVSFSEYMEEIQFQFSDTENFADRNDMDDIVANEPAGEGKYDESDYDREEYEAHINLTNALEKNSDSLGVVTSPVFVPRSNLPSGDNNIEVKSLPNLRSHIHDLERSDSSQLSRSLQPIAKNNGADPVKSMDSALLEPKTEGAGDSEEDSGPPELNIDVVQDDKHSDDLKVDSFTPFAELSLCRHLLSEGMGEDAARRTFDSEKLTLEKFRTMKQSLMRNSKLVVRIAGHYFPWDAAAPVVLGMISFNEEQIFEPKGMIKVEQIEPSTAPGGNWRIWPFSLRGTRTISTVQPLCESIDENSVPTPVKESDRERNKSRPKRMERKVRSLTPTSEELASLDLREGMNLITFTFSTAMLGKQQVDCRIYLWKWNTRIVISDVDGTITKSDVLGQFMPLVGVDWSQNGVAHLFSAIKENGYQLLFLSARAISQAHLTRQFLFNLKQDGKALPDGPVVISPDCLFPSLYREVIRKAPHEFKISCLEAIKALFPPDSNPFYAGFGNRDTDELSYLKVGIPMGKIFIINPKGEVAVNRQVGTKSYTSLHALVHGMFPPISSSSEQEDYNTWNYWKIPLPSVDS